MGAEQHYNGIESLDHPVIAALDLDVARRTFERLGFTVPPRGSHVEWGTGNLCIMFPDDYLEVRGIIDASRFTMDLDKHLDRFGEGLMGMAFGTSDIEHSHAEAVRNGIQAGRLRHLTRNFEHAGRWTQPAFDLFAPSAADADGLMHVVVLEHLTPELLRRPEFLVHANGCTGIDRVAGVIFDIERASGKLRRLLGDTAVTEHPQGVDVRLPGGQTIELLQSAAYATKYGNIPALPEPDCPRLGAVRLAVENTAVVAAVLSGNKVPFSRPARNRIRVAPEHACGVTLEFAEAGSE